MQQVQVTELPDGRTRVGNITCGTPFNKGSVPYLKKNTAGRSRKVWIPDHPTSMNKREWTYDTPDSEAGQRYIRQSSELQGIPMEWDDPESRADMPSYKKPGGLHNKELLKTFTPEQRDFVEQSEEISLEDDPTPGKFDPSVIADEDDTRDIEKALQDVGIAPDAKVDQSVINQLSEVNVAKAAETIN